MKVPALLLIAVLLLPLAAEAQGLRGETWLRLYDTADSTRTAAHTFVQGVYLGLLASTIYRDERTKAAGEVPSKMPGCKGPRTGERDPSFPSIPTIAARTADILRRDPSEDAAVAVTRALGDLCPAFMIWITTGIGD